MKKSILALSVALAAAPVLAQDEEKSITTDVELGFIATSGNTETTSIKGKVNVKQELTRFRNTYVAEAFYAEDQVTLEENGITRTETQTTAEKFFLSAQSDFKLNEEHKGIFLFGSYEQDEFSSFDYQATLALGYTDRLFTTESRYLSYSIGPGVASNKDRVTGETSTNAIVRLAGEYFWQISDNAKFTQTVSSEIPFESDENQKTKAETALTANITEGLAMKAAFIVDYNSEVAPGIKHADTQTSVTLVYSF